MGLTDLVVPPPVAPMLARSESSVPEGEYIYEPKWDGFRCLIFRSDDQVELASRNDRSLTRYFPEIAESALKELPSHCVLDGELVIGGPNGLDFEALQSRIHPAASRVSMLATKTPALFIAFDLLAIGDQNFMSTPFEIRRAKLVELIGTSHKLEPGSETSLAGVEGAPGRIRVTPATRDRALALDWFERFEGAGMDGVIAKRADITYIPNQRVMVKVKHARTAEFVVAGFRWHRSGPGVGSLLLGLWDGNGHLAHVGVIASFTAARRKELITELEPYRSGFDETHPWAGWADQVAQESGRLPGAKSRWSSKTDMSFEPLAPVLVVEAAYDHLQGNRLRHTARFVRWRPERDPVSCTYEQLQVPVPAELSEVFELRHEIERDQ